ncbi:imidazolonepropionase [Pseudothermotoga thermarum]|uniref:Imidazolonepropionase n=1 Tax=Pseudothermotoga thermarum DSM 5069 TaxID=688269 RepID=F7YYN1_9THEM|nr:imidazolonepropionase [Pseudothermotoga thermarum]AEH51063.1 imidazolonepropionase [Pseudothermotoga thermarum DSM 5069]
MNYFTVFAKKLYTALGNKPKRGLELGKIEKYENVYVVIENGKIKDLTKEKPVDAKCIFADLVIPGFVDCHTHIPFYGYREMDFLRRVGGLSYLDIHASGGGIYETVEKVKNAELSELVRFNLKLLAKYFKKGVTCLEGKTGYGLNELDELKQLQALKILGKISHMDVVPTFMAAHAVPKGTSPSEYMDKVIEMLQKVQNDCQFVDVFCDVGAFDLKQTEKLLIAAKNMNFKIRVHADEIERTGATQLAVKYGATSVEHVLKISEEDIDILARSNTFAVLMPATSYYLNEKYAPARELIDKNALVALASDFNPGSSPVVEPSFVMNLAVRYLKMNPYEVLTAFTLNSAAVLGLADKIGTIEPGKDADLLLYNDADLETVMYLIGITPDVIIKRGQIFEN